MPHYFQTKWLGRLSTKILLFKMSLPAWPKWPNGPHCMFSWGSRRKKWHTCFDFYLLSNNVFKEIFFLFFKLCKYTTTDIFACYTSFSSSNLGFSAKNITLKKKKNFIYFIYVFPLFLLTGCEGFLHSLISHTQLDHWQAYQHWERYPHLPLPPHCGVILWISDRKTSNTSLEMVFLTWCSRVLTANWHIRYSYKKRKQKRKTLKTLELE